MKHGFAPYLICFLFTSWQLVAICAAHELETVPLTQFDKAAKDAKDKLAKEAQLRAAIGTILAGKSSVTEVFVFGKTFHVGDTYEVAGDQWVTLRNPKPVTFHARSLTGKPLNILKGYGEICAMGPDIDPRGDMNTKRQTVRILGFYKDQALVQYSVSGTPMGTFCPSGVIFLEPLADEAENGVSASSKYFENNVSLDRQQKALDLIADFAKHLCRDVPLTGLSEQVQLNSDAKSELRSIVSSIAQLGFEGAATYSSEAHQGLLQEDLASTIKNNINCRLLIWHDLKDKLLAATVNGDQSQYSSYDTSRVIPLTEMDALQDKRVSREAAIREAVDEILSGDDRREELIVDGKRFHVGQTFSVSVGEWVVVRNPKPLTAHYSGVFGSPKLGKLPYGSQCGIGAEPGFAERPSVKIIGFYKTDALVKYTVYGNPMGTSCPSGVIFFQPLTRPSSEPGL